MDKLEYYLQLARIADAQRTKSAETLCSYRSAIRNFELIWHGMLPSTSDVIAKYVAEHAEVLSIPTLYVHLAALAQWHIDHGFPDPTKEPVVLSVLSGIKTLHPVQKSPSTTLELTQIEQVVNWLDGAIQAARKSRSSSWELRYLRNKAMLLTGFWLGLSRNELATLLAEYVQVEPGEGIVCSFPRSQYKHRSQTAIFKAPALQRLCPVEAYIAWTAAAQITRGPIFRPVSRSGRVGNIGLHIGSFVPILRELLDDAGIDSVQLLNGQSFKRDSVAKKLIDEVGCKNEQSCRRYVDEEDFLSRDWFEAALKRSITSLNPNIN